MRIDCTKCVMYDSEHCRDCLVTAMLHPPSAEVEWDPSADSSLATLADAGLIPMLRYLPAPEEAVEASTPQGMEEAG